MARKKKHIPWYRSNAAYWLFGAVLIAIIAALAVTAYFLMEYDAPAQDLDVLVTVNGEPVYTSEIETAYLRLPEQMRDVYTPEVVLNQTIDKMLVLQYAEAEGVVVDDVEVQAAIAEQAAMLGTNEAELRSLLEQQGATWEELEDAIREELVLTKFVDEELLPSITVSDEEIEAYYNANIAQYVAGEGEMRVRHVLVETEDEAYDVLAMALDGEDFDDLARQYSIGPSAPDGGDLGFISADSSLVEPFKEAALALEVGEVSDPVQTEFGWHVIYRDEDTISLSEASDGIEEVLRQQKGREAFSVLLTQLRVNADIQYYGSVDDISMSTPNMAAPELDVVMDAPVE